MGSGKLTDRLLVRPNKRVELLNKRFDKRKKPFNSIQLNIESNIALIFKEFC